MDDITKYKKLQQTREISYYINNLGVINIIIVVVLVKVVQMD